MARRRGRPAKDPAKAQLQTFLSDFAQTFVPLLHASFGITFPSPIYRADPVRFAREILGVDPWDAQVELLESIRDFDRVAAKSGHKTGKSRGASLAALWFYCSFPAARVVMSSTTARQVDAILWREIRMVLRESGRCLDCKAELLRNPNARIPRPCPHSSLIDGELAERAASGFKSEDFREIVGFTARQAEAVAGVSGAFVLYVVDEASGVPREIFEAIEGNRAGNAKLLLLGNPTKNEGEFFEAFNGKSQFYKCLTISSESTPNAVSGEERIPGLASRRWIEEKREEWGENSPQYLVRVKGEFAIAEGGKIYSLHTIVQAEARWDDTPAEGRLFIGIDPAGPRGKGDEIVFCVRRGLKAIGFHVTRGLDDLGHLAVALQLVQAHKLPRETPVLVVDRSGEDGSKAYRKLREYADDHPGEIEVVGVQASDKAMRQPELYARMRDALAANLAAWFDSGGAIPTDTKLSKELHLWEWRSMRDGRLQLWPDKDTARKVAFLGRSPDRYDALALSCWEPLSLRAEINPSQRPEDPEELADVRRPVLDPYAGSRIWERR